MNDTAPRRIGGWRGLLVLGLVAIAAVSNLHLLVGMTLLSDLAVPWRPQAGVVLVLGSLLVLRRVPLMALVVLVGLVQIEPVMRRAFPQPADPWDYELELVGLNLYRPNARHDAVLDHLRARDADVIVLLEVDDPWADALATLEGWPHRLVNPRDDNFGWAVLSRHPVSLRAVEDVSPLNIPTNLVQVDMDGGPLHLVVAHPPPPESSEAVRWRSEAYERIVDLVERAGGGASGPVVVVGDLNLTPWSPRFHELTSRTGLRDSGGGFGMQASWPSFLGPFGIPIDHVLVSPQVGVLARAVGPDVGSDHRPVWVRLGW